ncbi:MAG TPA: hypothetical protein V6C97_03275 [Oculatellaceae cyanobacterium]
MVAGVDAAEEGVAEEDEEGAVVLRVPVVEAEVEAADENRCQILFSLRPQMTA